MFERYLASLLDLLGYPSDSVVRYSSEHRSKFRAGAITHYPEGKYPVSSVEDTAIATVDLYEGSGWDIYQRARKYVALKVEGVVVELRSLGIGSPFVSEEELSYRLLAFALAQMQTEDGQETASAEGFATLFSHECTRRQLGGDCIVPGRRERPVAPPDLIDQVCDRTTIPHTFNLTRDHIPPYYDDARKAALVRESTIR